MDDFWMEHAESLIASCGADFLNAAPMEEVMMRADASFTSMGENVRSSILATARNVLASKCINAS